MNLYPKTYTLKPVRGQVMLLTVVLLSGTVLGTTVIAGILMLYQLREAVFATDSMRALFAADTGIEWELYKASKNEQYPKPVLENKAEFASVNDGTAIRATGYADAKKKVARAFEVSF